jgi:hypothetical protein
LIIDHAVNNVDRMVNTSVPRPAALTRLLVVYVLIVVGTLAALGILSGVAPKQATSDAWVHAIIVAVFAVVLPVRARAAARGDVGALRAVGIIAAVLFTVNVVEAVLPGLFPGWMRGEMVGIAALMAAVALTVVRERRRSGQ